MWTAQIIIILSVLWFGTSLTKSVQPPPYDYDDVVRLYRGKSEAEPEKQQRPTIQRYWQSFVRNIPFRFNMTNSIGSLFNAGTQQIIEAPVGVHQDVEPNRRRRKKPKRKSPAKESNERRRANSRGQGAYYAGSSNGYHQLQLQPLGVDEANIMHFYDPQNDRYYALHLVSAPNQYNQQQHYSPQEEEDDPYYADDHVDHHDHENPGIHEDFEDHSTSPDHEYDEEHHDDYENAEPAAESNDDYADDIQIAANWGYTDDEIFGERKLKLAVKPFNFKAIKGKEESINAKLSPRIVTIQKNLLKPETEEDVMVLLTKKKTQKPSQRKLKHLPQTNEDEPRRKSPQRRIKPNSSRKTAEDLESESVRNVLGSFMKDDSTNRRRQTAVPKSMKQQRFVEMPREWERYYIYPQFW